MSISSDNETILHKLIRSNNLSIDILQRILSKILMHMNDMSNFEEFINIKNKKGKTIEDLLKKKKGGF